MVFFMDLTHSSTTIAVVSEAVVAIATAAEGVTFLETAATTMQTLVCSDRGPVEEKWACFGLTAEEPMLRCTARLEEVNLAYLKVQSFGLINTRFYFSLLFFLKSVSL